MPLICSPSRVRTRYARSVTVVHRRTTFRASRIMQERAFADPRITFAYDSEVTAVHGHDQVTGVTLRGTHGAADRELAVDGLFVAIGHDPRSGLFRGRLDLDPDGYVLVRAPSTQPPSPADPGVHRRVEHLSPVGPGNCGHSVRRHRRVRAPWREGSADGGAMIGWLSKSAHTSPVRETARLWALGRVGLGVVALALPRELASLWTGPSARSPTGQVLGRALGGRDLVLGAGTWWALTSDRSARPWIIASGAADAVDAAATLLARRDLPHAGRRLITTVAATSAVVAAGFDRLLHVDTASATSNDPRAATVLRHRGPG